MSNSHDSHEGGGGKSVAWVVVLVVVLLALLVVPVLLVLGFVGFSTQTRFEVAPAVSTEIRTTINSANNSVTAPGANANVSINGATATVTSYGVMITAVADNGQWNNSQVSSTESRVEVKLDNQTIVLENSRLTINDVDFGTVQQGDQVRLEGGRVTVNGQDRNQAEAAAAGTAKSEPQRPPVESAP